jgi:hypothetical protein
MEVKLFEARGSHFLVHIKQDELATMMYSGAVYWAIEFSKNGESMIYYQSDENGMNNPHKEFNEDCKKAYDFRFCWRGVWEDRVYMKSDEELYCGDLRELADLWDQIEIYLKDRIKTENPDYDCFDD